MAVALSAPFVIPLTDAPSQSVRVTLNGQACRIDVYTKSINAPIRPPGMIVTDPTPVYENVNPVFLDLYVNDALVIGGVECHNESLAVIDPYLGFVGDLAIVDTQGNADPHGTPLRLPPPDLRNLWQRNMPLSLGGRLPPPPAGTGNTIPGLGTRFRLTYWPNLR